jgi:chromosome segregation ATPase
MYDRIDSLQHENKKLQLQGSTPDPSSSIDATALNGKLNELEQVKISLEAEKRQLEARLESERQNLEQEKVTWEQERVAWGQAKIVLEDANKTVQKLEDSKTVLDQKNKAMEQELIKTVGRTSEYEHRTTMMETQLKQMKSKWEDATAQIAAQEKSVTSVV